MSEPLVHDKPYKIYDYLPDDGGYIWDEYVVPHFVNYVVDLNIRLHPKRTFVLGELREVVYYEQFDGNSYTVPVIKETYVYDRDPVSQLANSRSQTIEWYDIDGNVGAHPKSRGPKYYVTMNDKREESFRKKRNQTSRGGEVVIGGLIQGGMSFSDAVSNGQAYWASLADKINTYESGNTQPLRDQIEADYQASTPVWLSEGLKNALLAELA